MINTDGVQTVANASSLDRAVSRAIDEVNRSYLADLDAAGVGACPNCLQTGGGHCWLCTTPDALDRLHDEASSMKVAS